MSYAGVIINIFTDDRNLFYSVISLMCFSPFYSIYFHFILEIVRIEIIITIQIPTDFQILLLSPRVPLVHIAELPYLPGLRVIALRRPIIRSWTLLFSYIYCYN